MLLLLLLPEVEVVVLSVFRLCFFLRPYLRPCLCLRLRHHHQTINERRTRRLSQSLQVALPPLSATYGMTHAPWGVLPPV